MTVDPGRIETLARWLADQYGFVNVTDELRTQVGSVLEAIEAQGWLIDTTVRTAELAGERRRGWVPVVHNDHVSPRTMIGRPGTPSKPRLESPRDKAAREEVW